MRAPRLLRAYGSYLALSLSSLILIAASANNLWAQELDLALKKVKEKGKLENKLQQLQKKGNGKLVKLKEKELKKVLEGVELVDGRLEGAKVRELKQKLLEAKYALEEKIARLKKDKVLDKNGRQLKDKEVQALEGFLGHEWVQKAMRDGGSFLGVGEELEGLQAVLKNEDLEKALGKKQLALVDKLLQNGWVKDVMKNGEHGVGSLALVGGEAEKLKKLFEDKDVKAVLKRVQGGDKVLVELKKLEKLKGKNGEEVLELEEALVEEDGLKRVKKGHGL